MNYIVMMFIIALAILIHELGHLLAGKWMRIPISRFSIGFGKTLQAIIEASGSSKHVRVDFDDCSIERDAF